MPAIFISGLESQQATVADVEKTLVDVKEYLRAGLRHPLEPRFKTVEVAIKSFQRIVNKRSAHLMELAKSNPLINNAPLHSMAVEADFDCQALPGSPSTLQRGEPVSVPRGGHFPTGH